MAQFQIRIADHVARVESLFDSTRDYCSAYLTREEPEYSLRVQRQDLLYEQQALDREALEEGMRRRVFTDPFLERSAIQRAVAERLLQWDTLLLHGSAVAMDGAGYLFMARCGTGKSTHTRLWRECFGDRAVMVNDDKPFVRVTPEGAVLFGAPWSGKHGLHSNIQVPLGGICVLERGSRDQIRPMSDAEALPMLYREGCAPRDREDLGRYRSLVETLAGATPLWHMYCTPRPEAARMACAAMSGVPENGEKR